MPNASAFNRAQIGLHTYNGYKITTKIGPAPDYADPVAKVFDPRDKRGLALFTATNFAACTKWIDAYIAGEQWAIEAKAKAPIIPQS